MFATPTDFNLIPYNIPDAETDGTLQDFIDAEEERRLKQVLGRPLYEALIAGNPTDAKWDRLINGTDYTLTRRKYTWDGLKKVMVPYIFSRYMSVNITELSKNGAIEAKVENATRVSGTQMISEAYNYFADRIGGDCGEWPADDTLFGMLYANRTDYDDVAIDAGYPNFFSYLYDRFESPGRMNQFNI